MFKSLESAEGHVDRLLKVAGNHNYFLYSIFVYSVFLTASVDLPSISENEESGSLEEGLNNVTFETLPTLNAEVVRSSTVKKFGGPSGIQDAKAEVIQSSSNQLFEKPGDCRVTTVQVMKSSSGKGRDSEILVSASTVFL